MIKLIIFDLDGVLVEAKHIHYDTLNDAIELCAGSQFRISYSEHLTTYDGLSTTSKLKLLTKNKLLPEKFHNDIWNCKQRLTTEWILSDLDVDWFLIDVMKCLQKRAYKIACCSNSIRKTVNTILSKLGIIQFFDTILSNTDVELCKPYPEIYWKAMTEHGALPEETLIVEDSPTGLLAATRSGANVLRVNSPDDVTAEAIIQRINSIESNNTNLIPKWQGNKMNILIPMAGAGSRFEAAGYTFPKPLIDVNGKPMIQVVVENMNIDANYIFIVQKSHRVKYNLDALLSLIAPGCKIIEVDGLTEGAACTTLLAKELIDSEEQLLIANSDQYIEWDSNDFMYKMNERKDDSGIVTFKSTHPKWSFVKTDDYGYVNEVAEKKPISDTATAGVYYWRRGSDYVKYAESMIQKNIRVNNEFYVCPVFNEAILDNKKIRTYNIEKMWGLGTPEDLTAFLQVNK